MDLFDLARPLRGLWRFEFWEGDVERDDEGRVLNPCVLRADYENLITTVGKQLVLDRLFGIGGAAALANTGVGTSATAAAVGDTALTGAVYKAFDATPTRTGLVVTAATTFNTSEANITIAEAGLSTASPGVLFNRLAPIGPFGKTSAVSMTITTTITQT